MDTDAAAPSAFFATLASPVSFAKLCKFLDELVDTVNLVFTAKGLEITSVDNARVALIHLELHQGAFISYDMGDARRHVIGIKVDSLCTAMSNVKLGDAVALRHKPDEALEISITREQNAVRQRSDYRVESIFIDQDDLEIPERNYPCEVLIPCGVVAMVCKELKPIGGEVEIAVSTESLRFTARKDLLQLSINFTPMARENSTLFAIKCDGACAQRFKFAFFNKLSKVCKVPEAKGLLVSLGENAPLSMLFHLEGLGMLNLYLAPLVEE